MTAWNMTIFMVHRLLRHTRACVCLCRSMKIWKHNVEEEGKFISHLGKCCPISSQVLKPSSVRTRTHFRSSPTSTHLFIFSCTSISFSLALSQTLWTPNSPSLSQTWHNNFSLNSLTEAGFRLRAKVPNSFRSKLTLCNVLPRQLIEPVLVNAASINRTL